MEAGDGPERWELLQDGLMIGGLAALLGAVHVLVPPAARADLAFDHGSRRLATVFTSAYVHIDAGHLLSNVAGYLAAATLAYGLTLQIGRRQWFRLTFAAFVVVLPVVVSLASYALLTWRYPGIEPVTRGFSGVGAGFVGFVFVALLAGLRRAFGSRTAVFAGLAIWLLLVFEVYVIYAGAVGLSVAGLLALGWGCCLWGLLGEVDLAAVDISEQWPALGQVLTVVILLVLFVAVLFPTRIVTNGAVTNVFAHAAGLLAGMAGAWLIHRSLYPVEQTASSEE